MITLSRFWPQSQTGDYDEYYYRDYTEDEEPIRDRSREEMMKSLYDKLYITYLNDKKMDKYGKWIWNIAFSRTNILIHCDMK